MSWLRREVFSRPYVADTILAVGVFVLTLPEPASPRMREEWQLRLQDLTPYDVTLAALICGALIFRRRWPRALLALTVAGFVAVIDGERGLLGLAPAIAMYTVASRSPRRRAWAYCGLAAGVVALAKFGFDGTTWAGSRAGVASHVHSVVGRGAAALSGEIRTCSETLGTAQLTATCPMCPGGGRDLSGSVHQGAR